MILPSRAAAKRGRSSADRAGMWWQSWRISVRIAQRDLRRHRGISALIVIMVALPVAVMVGFATLVATSDVSPVEALDWRLGDGQARVEVKTSSPIVQSVDGQEAYADGSPEAPHWTAAEMGARLKGEAFEVSMANAFLDEGGRGLKVSTLVMSAEGLATSGLPQLNEGRWPTAPDEILISPVLAARGIPTLGHVTINPRQGRPLSVTIVGVGTARDSSATRYGVISTNPRLGAPKGVESQEFVIMRTNPVAWQEVRQLNQAGLAVQSRDLIQHPQQVSASERYDGINSEMAPQDNASRVYVAGLVLALLFVTMLLAGPAFAVSATRRRRSLALIAATGATSQQLRRITLAQGLLLGVLAAPVGAVVGLVGAAAGLRLVELVRPGWTEPGPFEMNVPVTVGVTIAAAAAALVAAAWPAREAAQLDVARSLASRAGSEPGSGRPVALWVVSGMALTAGLGVSAWWIANPPSLFGGAIPLIVGAAIVVIISGVGLAGVSPVLLGRVFGLPIDLRVAVRDVHRQRTRIVPAMAAIIATTSTLTLLVVALASMDAQGQEDYVPQAPLGQVAIHPDQGGGEPKAALAEVKRQHADWDITPIWKVGMPLDGKEGGDSLDVAVQTHDCTEHQTLNMTDERCWYGQAGPLMSTTPTAALRAPKAEDLEALNSGTVLVGDPGLVVEGHIQLMTFNTGEGVADSVVKRRLSLPAKAIGPEAMEASLGYLQGAEVWINPETARKADLPMAPNKWLVRNPSGAITVAEVAAINERIGQSVILEQGSETDSSVLIIRGMVGVGLSLVLIATLISTALTRAESRPDLATMNAVGATPGALRRQAALQAMVICLLATAQGVLVGILPGAALATSITERPPTPDEAGSAAIVVIPWLALVGGGALAALLVAGVAAVTLRTRFDLTQRRA